MPLSSGHCFRRAKLEPDHENSKMAKLVGRMKQFRPKTRENFTKGCIFRWDDFADAKKEANQNKNFTFSTDFITKEDLIAIKNASGTKELKVYFRNRITHCRKNILIPEKDCDVMEGFNKELESKVEGDKGDK